MLGKRPLDVIRRGEDVFKEHYAGRELTDEEWMDALVAHPVLLERPIVVAGGRAIVARPPEVLEAWLKSIQ
jgi:arsenate reductase